VREFVLSKLRVHRVEGAILDWMVEGEMVGEAVMAKNSLHTLRNPNCT